MNPVPPPRATADLAKSLPLSEPAKLLLAPGLSVRQYFDALAGRPDLAADGVRVLAAALPKRECVWWGVTCVKEALPAPLPDAAVKAVTAAERWVREPTEANRRAAGAAADAAGHGTAAGCLAAAAFYSGGSLTPADCPVVPPRDDLTALAVDGALALAAVVDPLKADAARGRFVALGKAVATGQSRW